MKEYHKEVYDICKQGFTHIVEQTVKHLHQICCSSV